MILAILLAVQAPAASLDQAIDAYIEPCRRAAVAAMRDRDRTWLNRWARDRKLTTEQRDTIFLICAGYARAIDDLSRGRITGPGQ